MPTETRTHRPATERTDRAPSKAGPGRRPWHRLLGIAVLSASLGLTACGGGAADVAFQIGVVIAGQSSASLRIDPGMAQSVSVYAGQRFELDAGEPVTWTMQIGGSNINTSGATVSYAGLAVRPTAVSASRVVVDTASAYPFTGPLPVTFRATSTYDAALVATVNVWVY